jgi:phage gp36-like protein
MAIMKGGQNIMIPSQYQPTFELSRYQINVDTLPLILERIKCEIALLTVAQYGSESDSDILSELYTIAKNIDRDILSFTNPSSY